MTTTDQGAEQVTPATPSDYLTWDQLAAERSRLQAKVEELETEADTLRMEATGHQRLAAEADTAQRKAWYEVREFKAKVREVLIANAQNAGWERADVNEVLSDLDLELWKARWTVTVSCEASITVEADDAEQAETAVFDILPSDTDDGDTLDWTIDDVAEED